MRSIIRLLRSAAVGVAFAALLGAGPALATCKTSADCSDKEFCRYADADNVCGAKGPGTCTSRPQICTFELVPVCGCDGKDYSNACQANAGGTTVASPGKCGAEKGASASGHKCPEVVHCGMKNGEPKQYGTKCAAEADGATNIVPMTGKSCQAIH